MKTLILFLLVSSICVFSQDDEYLPFAEQMPQVIGGLEMLYVNLEYPEKAKKDGIEGKVYLLAYINEKGGLDAVKIVKAPSPILGEAAVNAAKSVKYSVGKNAGAAVKVKLTLCIIFKIK